MPHLPFPMVFVCGILLGSYTHVAKGLNTSWFHLQGYFQALFSCIMEELLCKMNVEKIVLPAAEEAELMWTRKFGFRKITEEEVSALQLA